MLSKKFKHNQSISCKLSFKTYSPLNLLIIQLKKLLPLLEKLLGTSLLMDFNIEKVIQILENFPKTYERNISLMNQASAIELLEDIIKYLLSSKKYRKFKPYHLYTSWKSIQEIIVKRISQEIKGNLELISNHQNILLYNFIGEIQYISSKIQDWAKLKYTKKEKPQQKLGYFYSETPSLLKTLHPSNRNTAVSSVYVSRDESKQDKHLNQECKDINQNKKTKITRIGTANLERKQMKMAPRCPSANQLLTNDYFKKPSHQTTKKSVKRKISKNNENDANNKILLTKAKKISKLNNFFIPNKIHQNQKENNKLMQTNTRNVSILNKIFQNNQPEPTHIVKDRQICKVPQDADQEISQLSKMRDDVSKQNQVNENTRLSINKETLLHEINEQIKSKQRTQQKKNTGIYSKRRQNKSQLGQQKRISIQSSQPLSKHQIKIKKLKVTYKIPRKTGKLSIKSIELIKSLEKQLNEKKQVSNFTTRRKAMLSEKKMSEIQEILNQSRKQAQYNKIKFQENVLLALADTLRVQKKVQKKQSLQKKQSNQTFEHKYCQLNKFIQNSEFNTQITNISIFFDQQEHIKRTQDLVLKEKIKSLRKKQPFSSIFELSCVTKNNKDILYNQIQRQFSFFSDAEWIKQACQMGNNLQQKTL